MDKIQHLKTLAENEHPYSVAFDATALGISAVDMQERGVVQAHC